VFAGYRLRERPMILCSDVDGTALASLQIRPARGAKGSGVISQTSTDGSFQGVLTVDDQQFELVMWNLTTDGVMMMDIGGRAREYDPEHWDKKDKFFWCGLHRNDGRLNRSNILWPMLANVCAENFAHFQETGEVRRLRLLAHAHSQRSPETASACAGGYPIRVYPKHGSRLCARFKKTRWCCPESIVVIGTPLLAGMRVSDYHIETVQNPRARRLQPLVESGWRAVAQAVADTYGVSTERLVAVLEIDTNALATMPEEHVHQVITQALDDAKLKKLQAERDAEVGQSRTQTSQAAFAPILGTFPSAARPAEVVLGEVVPQTASRLTARLFVEKFEFHNSAACALLCLGVEQRQLKGAPTRAEMETLSHNVQSSIEVLQKGRLQAHMAGLTVFEVPECVICLSGAPNAVLFPCGHRCVHEHCTHMSSLPNCPMCRSPVAAVLPTDPEARVAQVQSQQTSLATKLLQSFHVVSSYLRRR